MKITLDNNDIQVIKDFAPKILNINLNNNNISIKAKVVVQKEQKEPCNGVLNWFKSAGKVIVENALKITSLNEVDIDISNLSGDGDCITCKFDVKNTGAGVAVWFLEKIDSYIWQIIPKKINFIKLISDNQFQINCNEMQFLKDQKIKVSINEAKIINSNLELDLICRNL